MIEVIQNNPFRILGVYVDASAAEIKRNETKIRRFLEVGKSVTFPTDELGNLPVPERTNESLDKALSLINLPQEKLYHALFWYSGDNSCPFNQCIDDLLSNDMEEAIGNYVILLNNEEIISSFQKNVLGNVLFGSSEVIGFCLDGLFKIDKSKKMLELCETYLQPQDFTAAKTKFIAKPVDEINAYISTAKNADKSTPEKCLQICKQLINSTRKPLRELKVLLGPRDLDYQRIADSLAKQILQLGINYYNETDDDDKIENALSVQEYALSIAVGKLTKDRCQQNVDILHKHQQQSVSNSDVEEIATLLKKLENRSQTISSANDFLDECIPILSKLKITLGETNELYITISSAIANNALGFVINIVNKDTNSKSLAQSALAVIKRIEDLDINSETRKRIISNKLILLNNIAHMPSDFERANASTGGCLSYLIWAAIFIVIVFLAKTCG